jgi:outer membrane biosynthesis protein TonB
MRRSTMVEIVCLVSIAAFAACQPSQSVDAAAKRPEQLPLDTQQQVPEPVAQPVAVKPLPKKAIAKDANASATSKTLTIKESAKTAEATPVMTSAQALESRPAATAQDGEESIATTISGCLIRDDAMFQLKDTAGDHAPKSRSWKSGFIKKGAARVDLIDASNRLAPHVGYRITVSGTLTDREMQVNLVRGTTERCD